MSIHPERAELLGKETGIHRDQPQELGTDDPGLHQAQLPFSLLDKALKLQRYLYKPLTVRQGMEFAAFFPWRNEIH